MYKRQLAENPYILSYPSATYPQSTPQFKLNSTTAKAFKNGLDLVVTQLHLAHENVASPLQRIEMPELLHEIHGEKNAVYLDPLVSLIIHLYIMPVAMKLFKENGFEFSTPFNDTLHVFFAFSKPNGIVVTLKPEGYGVFRDAKLRNVNRFKGRTINGVSLPLDVEQKIAREAFADKNTVWGYIGKDF